jgi:ABC-type transport system involved in multi-copper enzyme maturation permease subunit
LVFNYEANTATDRFFGSGRTMFLSIVYLQFAGIYLFLPAMMCGVITQEKERSSLELLLLTSLRPSGIVLEKYFAGLVPIFSFLLLSPPLAALAYSFGGVQLSEIAIAAYFLTLAALQVGAFSLLASVWCRTTVGAFFLMTVPCYAWPIALGVVPGIVGITIPSWIEDVFLPLRTWRNGNVAPWAKGPVASMFASLPAWGATFLILALACWLLPRRASLPPRPWLRTIFGRLDGLMTRANRTIGGMVFSRRERTLPGREPLAWLDATRSALAHPAHVVRIALLLECAVGPLALGAIAMDSNPLQKTHYFDALLALCGGAAVIAVAVLGANAFATERVNQTLDVLLTTPLRAARMMGQKASAMHRLVLAGVVPAATLVLIAFLGRFNRPLSPVSNGDDIGDGLIFAFAAIASFIIDLPLLWWMSLRLAIGARSRLPAMLRALAAAAAIFVLPSVFLDGAIQFGNPPGALARTLVFFSPLEVLRISAGDGHRSWFGGLWPVLVVVHLLLAGGALLFLQQRCLRGAESLLRG